jgi:hypothetical protein
MSCTEELRRNRMIKIIPITKERMKKFNVFGAAVSVGFAKYAMDKGLKQLEPFTWQLTYKRVNYLYDHEELDGVITHRLILWRVKIEVKSMVKYDFKFA